MRARIPLADPETMTPAQRALRDSILATRPSIEGPFLAWLYAPALATAAEKLGAHCRYGTSLSRRETELLIMMTAAHFDCEGEWDIHGPIALDAGLAQNDLALIRLGELPTSPNPRERAIATFGWELLRSNRVGQDTFKQAEAELGLEALVEITGVVGYYALAAMTLNAFEMRAD